MPRDHGISVLVGLRPTEVALLAPAGPQGHADIPDSSEADDDRPASPLIATEVREPDLVPPFRVPFIFGIGPEPSWPQ